MSRTRSLVACHTRATPRALLCATPTRAFTPSRATRREARGTRHEARGARREARLDAAVNTPYTDATRRDHQWSIHRRRSGGAAVNTPAEQLCNSCAPRGTYRSCLSAAARETMSDVSLTCLVIDRVYSRSYLSITWAFVHARGV